MSTELEALEQLKAEFKGYAEQHRRSSVDCQQRATVQHELWLAAEAAADMVEAKIARLKETTK